MPLAHTEIVAKCWFPVHTQPPSVQKRIHTQNSVAHTHIFGQIPPLDRDPDIVLGTPDSSGAWAWIPMSLLVDIDETDLSPNGHISIVNPKVRAHIDNAYNLLLAQ